MSNQKRLKDEISILEVLLEAKKKELAELLEKKQETKHQTKSQETKQEEKLEKKTKEQEKKEQEQEEEDEVIEIKKPVCHSSRNNPEEEDVYDETKKKRKQ